MSFSPLESDDRPAYIRPPLWSRSHICRSSQIKNNAIRSNALILPYACVQARVKEQQTQKQLLTVRSMAPSSPLLNETRLWKHWLTERKDQSALTAMYDEIITGVSCFLLFSFSVSVLDWLATGPTSPGPSPAALPCGPV